MLITPLVSSNSTCSNYFIFYALCNAIDYKFISEYEISSGINRIVASAKNKILTRNRHVPDI